jgi:hypothetical protein
MVPAGWVAPAVTVHVEPAALAVEQVMTTALWVQLTTVAGVTL